jgi:hypothetical protein
MVSYQCSLPSGWHLRAVAAGSIAIRVDTRAWQPASCGSSARGMRWGNVVTPALRRTARARSRAARRPSHHGRQARQPWQLLATALERHRLQYEIDVANDGPLGPSPTDPTVRATIAYRHDRDRLARDIAHLRHQRGLGPPSADPRPARASSAPPRTRPGAMTPVKGRASESCPERKQDRPTPRGPGWLPTPTLSCRSPLLASPPLTLGQARVDSALGGTPSALGITRKHARLISLAGCRSTGEAGASEWQERTGHQAR